MRLGSSRITMMFWGERITTYSNPGKILKVNIKAERRDSAGPNSIPSARPLK